jgi:hypothetical protein
MSALPNTLPSQQKKTPGRASKAKEYGRDPQSPSERLRASSDYDTEKGYSPFFHAFLADLPRLTSGNSCTLLMMTLWAKSAGRGAAKGDPRPDWTLALSVEDLAQICRCDVRTIERELVALDKRGLAEIRRPGKGEIEARLRYRDWEALPDYRSSVVEMAGPDETVPELTDEQEAKPGNQRVTGRKPVRLPAGALSKVFPVSCGVKTFRHKAEGPVDMEFSCVIQAGELLVVSRFPDDWREKVVNSLARSNGINENIPFPRHGCREEQANVGRNNSEANVGRKVAPVTHPRAPELVNLFDPLLAKSAAGLLSGDSSSLLAACEAVGDCDHNYLVKFAVQRASRPIKSPLHVKAICAEALASWKASLLPGAVFPQKSSKKKGFTEGVMETFARRLARDGKI